ncbi:tRNA1(Val) (adenine(37)-N6)-methyltransferase [Minwuia sp.]|uniref:tRNA1(Val) (adenine(37)-N6)-methyltransferase n=1 Tax=Minwuia sp. TaxID=2493630 RepID=UPI003A9474EA
MKPPWTDDRLLGGRVLLRQPRTGFRSGSDAVLLAAACDPPWRASVLELGCGTGAPMLALAARRRDISFTGLERDPETAALAACNIVRNGFRRRGQVMTGDVNALPCPDSAFDLVLANPPYFVEGRHRISPDPDRNRGRAETSATLAQWIRTALSAATPSGTSVFIMRMERLDDALTALPPTHGADMLPILGNPQKPPKRVLLRIRRGQETRSLNPIRLHHPDGEETMLARSVFRHAAPIFWR